MSVINTIPGVPLGYVIYFAYNITGSYGIAIFIFALATRIILFPVNILTHRNSIRLLQIQPSLNILKRRFADDTKRLNEERYKLFKQEKYNPVYSLIPLLIQLFLIVGVMQVMYNPLQHILRLDRDIVNALTAAAHGFFDVQSGYGEQLSVLNILQSPGNITLIMPELAGIRDIDSVLSAIINTNLNFTGLNLGITPSLINPSSALIIPFLSGFSAFAYCLVQSSVSPGALSQNRRTNRLLTSFTVAFSVYFALVTPLGVGLYWTACNLLSIISAYMLYFMYNPKKLAADAITQLKSSQKTTGQLRDERRLHKQLRIREKTDAARFNSAKKRLVFYAISAGQFKYYKTVIEYILNNSDINIHYLTNDPDDSVFNTGNKKLIPYYAGQGKTISLLLKLDTEIFVTTVPELQNYHMKRSVAGDNIEYIYMCHGLGSTNLTIKETAYDHFDTVFCAGPHQVAELQRREEMANLKQKKLVKIGFGVYDQLALSYAALDNTAADKPRILIAPSWQDGNIMESYIDSILESLIGKGYEIIIRPHPQFIRYFPDYMKTFSGRYRQHITDGELVLNLDFSLNEPILTSDILITDWSNIAFEFAYATLKPCIFINTPLKILNPNYEKSGIEALEITLRDKVGVIVEPGDIQNIHDVVGDTLNKAPHFEKQISQAVQQYLFHPGRSGEAGGRYIISRLQSKR